jgi:hypothetical protein
VRDERAWYGERLLDLTAKALAIRRHFVDDLDQLGLPTQL